MNTYQVAPNMAATLVLTTTSSFSLLLLLALIHFQSLSSSSSPSNPPIILALKASKISSGFSVPDKLPFHHNVTLTVSLQVGTPPQSVSMVLDTGSELSYLNCNTTNRTSNVTNNTGLNPRPVFDPNISSSYANITCSSPTCTSRTQDFTIPVTCDPAGLCHAMLSYADMSSAEGTLGSDTFQLGSSNLPDTVFGCMVSGLSSNPQEDNKTTGLLGMNRGSLSFISQMGLRKFSYCISGSDYPGLLLLGESNITASLAARLNYTPLIQISTPLPYFNRVAYTVQLTGIRVGERDLDLPPSLLRPDRTGAGQTMVDSGTQFSVLLGPVYSSLRSEFYNQTVNKGILKELGEPNFVFGGVMDLCYRVPANQTGHLPELPAVALLFDGAEMRVSAPDRLLYRLPGEKRENEDAVYCFTFGNSDLLGVEAYLIGHHHQQNLWVEFDLEKSRMGLAPVRCDLAAQKLDFAIH